MHDRPDTHAALPDWFGVPADEATLPPANTWLGIASQPDPAPVAAGVFDDGFRIPPAIEDAPAPYLPTDDGRLRMHDGVVGSAQGAAFGASTPAWSFHTPNGLQSLVPGARASAPANDLHVSRAFGGPAMPSLAPAPAGAGTDAAQRGAATAVAASPARGQRTRIRWETLVPTITSLLLLGALALLIADFDRVRSGSDRSMNAHDHAAAGTSSAGGSGATHDGDSAAATAAVDSARSLLRRGAYDRASAELKPALAGSPSDDVLALRNAIIDGRTQDAALRGELAVARTAGDLPAVLDTLAKLEQLHPLTSGQRTVRAEIIRTVADRAAARRAAAGARSSRKKTATARPRATTTHTPHTAAITPATPPRSGGTASGGGATPPGRDASPGTMPPVPHVPNSTAPGGGGSVSGQPATTGSGSTAGSDSMAGMVM